MRKLVAATILAAVALAAQSAAACDWNREAATAQQQVATTGAPAQPSLTTATTPQPANVASSKPVEPTAPVVRVNERN
jgi:ABC-type phosphate transport system substrate-binding protein